MIEPRIEKSSRLVQQVMRESGFEEVLSSGIVLTGGSASCRAWWSWRGYLPQARAPRHPKYSSALADMVAQPVRPRSWVCWKKRAWHACAASKVAQKSGL